METNVKKAFNSLSKDQQDAVVNFAELIVKSSDGKANAYGNMPGSSGEILMGKKSITPSPVYEDGEDPEKVSDPSNKSNPLM